MPPVRIAQRATFFDIGIAGPIAGFAVADPTQSGAASHHHLTMVGIVLAGLLGTMVGSWVAYGVGRVGRLGRVGPVGRVDQMSRATTSSASLPDITRRYRAWCPP